MVRAAEVVVKKRPVVTIGITGGTGSGKTTIAEEVCRNLGSDCAVMLHQDSYYLDLSMQQPEERTRTNFDHPSHSTGNC